MSDPFALVLDRVGDPGNFGPILRTARAVGLHEVWLTRGTADPFSDKVVRSASGAQFSLKIRYGGDLTELAADLRKLGVKTCYRTLPSSGGTRAFDFEVCLEELDVDAVKVRRTKRVYSSGYYRAAAADEKMVVCPFALADLPAPNGPLDPLRGRRWRFVVRPCDCFGKKGAAIATGWCDGCA